MQRCNEQEIAENHHAIPRDVLEQQKQLEKKQAGGQPTLDAMLPRVPGPRSFSREEVLKRVAQFIVCDDQVS